VIRAAILLCVLLAATQTLADSITIGGTERTFAVFVPEKTPAPLVLVLHGNTQQGIDMQTRASWPELARRERFIAVYPDGLNRAWGDSRSAAEVVGQRPPAGTDDVTFLLALVEKYIKDGTADPRRIYIAGVSNGGAMAMTLACEKPEVFAAAAAMIISFTATMAERCAPRQPIAMLLMNGTADPLVAYQGGKGASPRFGLPNMWSTERTIAFWRKVNGCDAGDRVTNELPNGDPDDGSTVTRVDSRCPAGLDVVLYRVNNGGHRVPGKASDAKNKQMVDALLGPQNHDIDGPEVTWAFFKRFAR
jgi:polyhydroxybutyrate depolymerase